MISVLIPTLNEALTLGGCLDSVAWCDDIHVFDSYSSDTTEDIVRRRKVHFHKRQFDGHASQKNAALQGVQFRYPWVLLLDADERVPERLSTEMLNFTKNAPLEVVAARMRRRDYFEGTWLKHAQISPFYIRLVRPRQVHFEREINEILVPHGEVTDLKEHFDHFPFSKGVAYWVERHNRYSTLEAQRAVAERAEGGEFSFVKALFSSDFNRRRYHQKGLFYRLPCRPFIKFCYMIFVRCAFLDGRAGWTYARLQAFYEFLIVVKERELATKANGRNQ